jgi:AcrR family transcriptional regulator
MELPQQERSETEDRIIAAAASLFGKRGYSGVSTRDIAIAAEVHEVTIYRHHPRKRDLYLAVLSDELRRIHLPGDQLRKIAEASSARQALVCVFELIDTVLRERPLVLPLVLYGGLEADAKVDALFQRYLGEFIEILAHYLDAWWKADIHGANFLFAGDSREIVMALISIVVFRGALDRVFPGGPTRARAVGELADLSANLAELEK